MFLSRYSRLAITYIGIHWQLLVAVFVKMFLKVLFVNLSLDQGYAFYILCPLLKIVVSLVCDLQLHTPTPRKGSNYV